MYQNLPTQINPRMPKRLPHSLGFARYALSFDGVDDYVDAGNLGDFFEQGTIEYWFNTARLRNWDNPFSTHFQARNVGIRFEINAFGKFRCFIGDNAGTWGEPVSWPDVAIDTWYHIVLVWDRIANTASGYRNGQLIGGPSAHTLWPATLPSITIGNGFNATRFFNGLINKMRIYAHYGLDPDEVKWNFLNYHNPVRPDKLALWLPMEEGQGEIVYDKSGHGNNGTLLPAGAGPTWQRLRQWELRAAVE